MMTPDAIKYAALQRAVLFWKTVALLALVFALGWASSTIARVAHAEEAGPSELHLIRLAIQDMAKDTKEMRKTPAAIDELRKTCKK